jgi:hypothetical protein
MKFECEPGSMIAKPIPPKEPKFKRTPTNAVKKALHVVMVQGETYTQEDLRYLVLKEIHRQDSKYTIACARLRHIAALIMEIKIKTKCKIGKKPIKSDKCPVCNIKMTETKNKTLDGPDTYLSYICHCCGYWTDKNRRRIPKTYSFTYQ